MSNKPALPSTHSALTRLLETPDLVAQVRGLPAPALAKLVRHVGLEDAGELVALATPAQLTALLDDDVWAAPRPGERETLDPRRFALWTEILLESGAREAAAKLAALDETFLAAALSRLLRVFDSDFLGAYYAEADEADADRALFEKALEGSHVHEFDAWLVAARSEDGWDALIDVLTSLDEQDHALFVRLMTRLQRTTEAAAGDHGGYGELLAADEELLEDAAAERDERRASEGYVEPVTAKTLLRVLAQGKVDAILAETTLDPVVATYLREIPMAGPAAAGDDAWASELRSLLRDDGPAAPARKRLPTAGGGAFLMAMQALIMQERTVYDAVKAHLAFFANVLVAGDASKGRALRPHEAAEAVLAACEQGLARLAQSDPARADGVLGEPHGVILLFRLGRARS
jgi:hypothetical protein